MSYNSSDTDQKRNSISLNSTNTIKDQKSNSISLNLDFKGFIYSNNRWAFL